MLLRLLLAVDSPELQDRLRRMLEQEDLVVDVDGETDDELIHTAGHGGYDLAIISRERLQDSERDLVEFLRSLPEPVEVVVVSREENPEDHTRLLAAGCLTVLEAGVPDRILQQALGAILNRRRAEIEQTLPAPRTAGRPQLADFVSASGAMQAFLNVVRRVAPGTTSLLITGETGVGKEHLARAIHAEGNRKTGPFVTVNCGALPETLLESELFGHEEGAFTGASRARRGWFELAHGGTIFLDEIAELPLHLQVKLLHVLQNHQIQRLGGERTLAVDVRVIAATNRDLRADVEQGRFRRDLYYRLGVVTLAIPPLRERREDIPPLVDDYIAHFRETIGGIVAAVSPEALQGLVNYAWPGNVRELINVVERAVLLCETDTITLADLPEEISAASRSVSEQKNPLQQNPFESDWLDQPIRTARKAAVAAFESVYLTRLLQLTGGRIGETAHRAGIDPRSLYEKMRRHGLRKEDFRRR